MHTQSPAAGSRPLPIGYWLRRADALLTRSLERTLQPHGLDRFGWQVLNLLCGTAASEERLRAALADFGGPGELTATLAELRRRGWIGPGRPEVAGAPGTVWAPTDTGRSVHRLVAAAVRESRAAATAGVDPGDYATALAVLERLCGNLGDDGPDPLVDARET
ncbi:MarR family winged helix-turn-helix transcriptional regulator [Allostreptomyces psammosilenae]|uniref:MarR family transcriptional regulator n=1 Tax=Allostreptomyces psammosilenae TaxID=1892865 RepID=A0A852ZRH1_9ACTN|nr:MarR family transcriptional regulator [Allostreptomyces psammosilenae]NYI04077.1 hypothetical protein [Allostreptomyces psammosilenae]